MGRRSVAFAIAAFFAAGLGLGGVALALPDGYGRLTPQERGSVDQVCGRLGDAGSSPWLSCVERQLGALDAMNGRPRTDLMRPEDRAAAEQFCKSSMAAGPAVYYRCLDRQVTRFVTPAQLSKPVEAPAASPYVAAAPAPAEVHQLSVSKQTAKDPVAALGVASPSIHDSTEWPKWGGIAVPNMPARIATKTLDPAELFEKAGRSIYVTLAAKSIEDLRALKEVSQASAVAIAPDMLVTNCHAVKDRPVIIVAQDGKYTNALLHRADVETDRCFLNVLDGGLTPVAGVRSFDQLKVGERVYTIGAPRGLQRTLGEGLVSGLRTQKGLKLIQTSAVMAPGSSGGGLFDVHGNLVGVTTFALGSGEQMNFAIAAAEYWR